MSDTAKTSLDLLRQPFPPHQISYLPKGGVKLAYVGHAALTDRLLDVDAGWTWEPLALGPNGLPVLDESGGLWIKLTVCGVTRLGYGDAGQKKGGDAMKERIGDALRNAAMRFGAALDLWHKGDLHADEHAGKARAVWMESQRLAIFAAANVGELRAVMTAATQTAMDENDSAAVDQLNAWAEEKRAQAKPKAAA